MLPQKITRLLAFYLPQFHPIPENDEWWGPGFTEWRNVTRGVPLFKGHYQPHVPTELGYYDLRLAEVREQQAELAQQAGLDGFIYYHYWFGGRRLLNRPFDEVLKLGEPDFPFCLCWANESWSRNWDGNNKHVLMPQVYSEEDDREHIRWLCTAFEDDRYIKVDGRPLLFVYRPSNLPSMRRTADTWRSETAKRGFPGLLLCGAQAFVDDLVAPESLGLDAAVEFKPNLTNCGPTLRPEDPLDVGYLLHRVWAYDSLVQRSLETPLPPYAFFPGLCPSWDNAVRRKEGGAIFKEASPEKYHRWLREILFREWFRPQRESIVTVNAWNEWAEGNHLEPCEQWGRGYIEATRRAFDEYRGAIANLGGMPSGARITATPGYEVVGHIDSRRTEAGEHFIEGWTIDAKERRAPDMLALAERAADGSFKLIGPVASQRMLRPDVAAAEGQTTLLSGWKASYRSVSNGPDPSAVTVLALRGDQGAAIVGTVLSH